MKTINENNREVGSSAYWGERGDWFIVSAQHRDSDCLTRSNFCSFQKLLGDEGTAVESFNHWAVGWVEYLLIDPTQTELVALAEKTREKLEDSYPVLDENDFSELEMDEANETWKNCYRPAERIEYVRKHRSQFKFRSFREMLECVRGLYFCGYASELLN